MAIVTNQHANQENCTFDAIRGDVGKDEIAKCLANSCSCELSVPSSFEGNSIIP